MPEKEQISPTFEEKNTKRLEDFLIVLLKWRKVILWNTIVLTLAAIIISLFLDNWYLSTASILPPKKKGLFGEVGGGGLASKMQDISKTLGRLGSSPDETFNYLTILQSRRTSLKVIQKFDLRNVYKIKANKPIEDVFTELQENIKFNVEEEGNLTINVWDKSPQRAADMANYFVQVLNEISLELFTAEARVNKEFLEKRFNEVKTELANAENAYKMFNEKHNIVAFDEQTRFAIREAADLKAQIRVNQIEAEIVQKNMGSNYFGLEDIRIKISELQKRLLELKIGKGILLGDENQTFNPLSGLPDISLTSMRLMKDIEIRRKLMEFLLPLLEQSKIEQQKDIPVCLVLDSAVPAEKKISPKRSIIISVVFVIAFFFSIIFALMRNSISELKKQESRYSKINDGIFRPLRKMFLFKT